MKDEYVGPEMVSQLTLRDYFAAKAMAALISQDNIIKVDELCANAYFYADAMIDERK